MTSAGSYGTTLFCDDIRDETLGKKTFVGCYTERLIASEFPVLLPTFAMFIRFLEPLDEANDVLKITITLECEGNEPITVLDAEVPTDRRQQVDSEHKSPEADHLASIMYLRSSPFVIEKPGQLKVRATRGEERFKLGTLRIINGDIPQESSRNQATIVGRLDNN